MTQVVVRAGSGQFQFHRLRDRVLNLEPLPTTPDYEVLFGEFGGDCGGALTWCCWPIGERSFSDSLCRGVGWCARRMPS